MFFKGNYWLPKVLNRVDFNNFSEKQNIVSNLLILRNIPENQINNFLNPKLKNLLPDPSTIDDMDKATDKICELIIKKNWSFW